MRKSKSVWMLLLLLALLLTACSNPVEDDHHDHDHSHPVETPLPNNSGNNPSDTDTPVTGSIVRVSVLDASDTPTATPTQEEPTLRTITTLAQWKEYCNIFYPSLSSKYSNNYFENHSVVVYRRTEESSSIDLSVIDALVRGGKLVIVVRRHEPFLKTPQEKSWCFFVEIEGNVKLDERNDVTVEFLKANS